MKKDVFYAEAYQFIDSLIALLEKNEVVIEKNWHVDHLCYRSTTKESYQKLKNDFAEFSHLLVESEVGGRLISTFKLAEPINSVFGPIEVVELPEPKEGKVTIEGFEHIEVVCDVGFGEILLRYPHLNFDKKGLQKNFNQELEIVFGEKNIKFHYLSLESVVNLEKNYLVWNALEELQILKTLNDFSPLIAGTFPLNVYNENSDIDLLLEADSLYALKETLLDHYQELPGFEVFETKVDELPTLICRFSYNKVPFEIFAQNKNPVLQKAYRHFLVEEKLLKLGGELFRNKVMSLREKGLKTEEAFSKALSVNEDPYQYILSLEKLSMEELRNLISVQV